jgi:small subunit ribosomal protein S9
MAEKEKKTTRSKTAAKKTVKKAPAKKTEVKKEEKTNRYFEAVGRRKTSVARVRLFTQGDKDVKVNEKGLEKYFPTLELQQISVSPLEKMKCVDHFKISIKVSGGGVHSQAEAVRHGIARALVKFNADFRKKLRRAGHITRDPRRRERKKFGLKRARRAPQWSKR